MKDHSKAPEQYPDLQLNFTDRTDYQAQVDSLTQEGNQAQVDSLLQTEWFLSKDLY